jgi:ankyrin repeat protein
MIILRQLLNDGHEVMVSDYSGTTCLQIACLQGNFQMAKDLITHGADVTASGKDGTLPLYDCISGGNIEIANLLLSYGSYVNAGEINYQQSPLMRVCELGQADFARLFILQGADVFLTDSRGWTAAHYAVYSNSPTGKNINTARGTKTGREDFDYSEDIYNALREADANFDFQDIDGNSPLHLGDLIFKYFDKSNWLLFLAAECGLNAVRYAIHLLHGGAYSSFQNNSGNQPSHIAAKLNQLELLKQICVYDEHIGRVVSIYLSIFVYELYNFYL